MIHGLTEKVFGAGFSAIYYDKSKTSLDLMMTSPTMASIEKLKKGDEIFVVVGRKQRGSDIVPSTLRTIHFSVEMLAPDGSTESDDSDSSEFAK